MPPEVLSPEPNKPRPYSRSADMWGYGVTVWEMYSKGILPFKGKPGAKVKEMLMNGEQLAKPPDCPQPL